MIGMRRIRNNHCNKKSLISAGVVILVIVLASVSYTIWYYAFRGSELQGNK